MTQNSVLLAHWLLKSLRLTNTGAPGEFVPLDHDHLLKGESVSRDVLHRYYSQAFAAVAAVSLSSADESLLRDSLDFHVDAAGHAPQNIAELRPMLKLIGRMMVSLADVLHEADLKVDSDGQPEISDAVLRRGEHAVLLAVQEFGPAVVSARSTIRSLPGLIAASLIHWLDSLPPISNRPGSRPNLGRALAAIQPVLVVEAATRAVALDCLHAFVMPARGANERSELSLARPTWAEGRGMGAFLDACRRQSGLTQDALVDVSGLGSRTSLTRWLSGKTKPRWKSMTTLARALAPHLAPPFDDDRLLLQRFSVESAMAAGFELLRGALGPECAGVVLDDYRSLYQVGIRVLVARIEVHPVTRFELIGMAVEGASSPFAASIWAAAERSLAEPRQRQLLRQFDTLLAGITSELGSLADAR